MSGAGELELERTPGEVAVSGNMAKGAGKSLVIINNFASSQVTNSRLSEKEKA